MGEVQAALLNPARPVCGADFIRIMKDGMDRIELGDRRVLVRHPVMRAGDAQRKRCESAIDERILLVLDDQETAVLGVVEQPPIVGDERRLGFVGAAADHDGVVVRQIAARERIGVDQLERHTDGQERFGHAIGGAANVADVR